MCATWQPNPLSLSDSKLRETVYEILVGACRISEPKPLTYIPQSEKTDRNALTLLLSSVASRVKKALGLKLSFGRRLGGGDTVSQGRS
ncbi:unnamed protein product [Malus baccata var. baccata]